MAAQFVSVGKVVVGVPGTPVQVPVPAAMNPPSCHAAIIEVLSTNTGKCYVGLVGMNKTTLAGVLIVLPVPSTNVLPTFSIALTVASNAIPLGTLYIDADVAGEGVLISGLVA